MEDSAQRDPRVYFAAERTFLAWIRTGLALMGGGFAVAKFGYFMSDMGASGKGSIHATGNSPLSGVALVMLGVIVNVGATVRHIQLTRELSSGTWIPGRVSKGGIALSLVLAVIGLAMAAYLVVVRR